MKRLALPSLDRIDVKILAALQRDGRMTMQSLAAKVGLTARPALERVRRLRASGIIIGFQAVIDLAPIVKPVTVFCEIALERQARHEQVERRLRGIEELVECWEISGAFDYLARFVCPDLVRFETLTSELIADQGLGLARIVSHVALRAVRPFAGLPVGLLASNASD
ncbi:MAG TPA: Lrp/AsnC family transcriptional regulator [Stellaceae bacterium]|nr:Lrp/AsnC family transcriptional regulator [Stellaceae bacterium]